jgi:putative ABC transport system ATP-binding protein
MIVAEGLARDYAMGAQQVHALRDVSLNIAAGEYVSLMGPSGSGKSTLLNLLGLLDRPDRGRYTLDGVDASTLDDNAQARLRRERIGFVFQAFHLIPRLSALENIALPLMLAGIAPAERQRRAEEALVRVGLGAQRNQRPAELSGGQSQRVAIARATVTRPALLLADEPTGNLDQTTGSDIMALLESLNAEGATLIIVTHDSTLGARARRRLQLLDGRIVADERRE